MTRTKRKAIRAVPPRATTMASASAPPQAILQERLRTRKNKAAATIIARKMSAIFSAGVPFLYSFFKTWRFSFSIFLGDRIFFFFFSFFGFSMDADTVARE